MVTVYGFAGMRDYDGTLSFRPNHAPERQSTMRFPLTYRGQMLEVEVGTDATRYVLREGERIVFRHEDEVIELTRDAPDVVRPNIK
jgi:alpha,alpha-trehalose phosphorylase